MCEFKCGDRVYIRKGENSGRVGRVTEVSFDRARDKDLETRLPAYCVKFDGAKIGEWCLENELDPAGNLLDPVEATERFIKYLKGKEAFADKKTEDEEELRAAKMEVTEFYRNVRRLCDSHGNCLGCPLYDNHCAMDQWGKMSRDSKYLDRVVEMVKDWAAEHPALTNRDVLVKIFGKDFSESVHPGALAFHVKDCEDDDYREWLNTEYTGPFKLLL